MRPRTLLLLVLLVPVGPPLAADDGDLVPSFFGDGIFYAGTTSHLLSLHGAIPASDGAAVAFGHYIDKSGESTTASGMHWRRVTETAAGSECNVPIPGADYGWITAAEFDSLGRLVVAGLANFDENKFLVARFLYPACDLDESFDSDGIKTFDFAPDTSADQPAHAVGVQNLFILHVDPFSIERDIVVAGKVGSDVGLARLDADGDFHTAFGGNGKVIFDAGDVEWPTALELGPSGELIVSGYGESWSSPYLDFFALAVQTASGAGALAFGGAEAPWAPVAFDVAGQASDYALDLDVTDEGRIYLSGWAGLTGGIRAAIAALDGEGDPVTAFSADGRLDYTAFPADATSGTGADALLVLSNDKLLVAGEGTADDFHGLVLARRLENGPADTSFGTGGFVRHPLDVITTETDELLSVTGIAPVGRHHLVVGYAQDTGINRQFLVVVENSLIFADDFETGSTSNW